MEPLTLREARGAGESAQSNGCLLTDRRDGRGSAKAGEAPVPLAEPVVNRANGGSDARILIIDDTRAIHDDFRKVLTPSGASELEKTEAELFGEPAVALEQINFILDSAYQ